MICFRGFDRQEIARIPLGETSACRFRERSSVIPVSVQTIVMRRWPSVSWATSISRSSLTLNRTSATKTLLSRLTVTSWTASNSRPRSCGLSWARKAEAAGTAELAVSGGAAVQATVASIPMTPASERPRHVRTII